MKKFNKKILSIVISSILLLFMSSVTYAWLASIWNSLPLDNISGGILEQYFHCGDGSEENPYVITRPVHYYHLTEFYQRLQKLSVNGHDSSFGKEYLYFQIGYDLDGDPSTYEVYEYNDKGEATGDENYSTILNMSGYSSGLMPIGTSQLPFYGTFDGKGITISNLNIISEESIKIDDMEVVRKTNDVGVFGYVSSAALVIGDDGLVTAENTPTTVIKNVYFDKATIDIRNAGETDGSLITDENGNIVVEHDSSEEGINVGIIAGHISISSTVDEVYINRCTIKGGGVNADSSFGYFGAVDNADGTPVTTLGSLIASLRGAGENAGFGGSLDMMDMLTRLQNVYTLATKPSNYYSEEIVTINEATGERSITYSSQKSISYAYSSYQYKYYESEYAGKYYYYERNDMSGYQFMLMYGESSLNKKNVTTYTYRDEFVDALYIRYGSNYLSVDSVNKTITRSDTEDTKWVIDELNRLYTEIDTVKYYLSASNGSLVLSEGVSNTYWTKSPDSSLYTTIDAKNFYLVYDNDRFQLTNIQEYYLIGDGIGNYLSANSTLDILNITNPSNSVHWGMSNPSGSTYIYCRINDKTYYLIAGDGVPTLSTTGELWQVDHNGNYYVERSGYQLYLAHDESGWKVALQNGNKISDSLSHYLFVDSNGFSSTSSADATMWLVESNAQGYTIRTNVGSEMKYLSGNPSLTLSNEEFYWKKSGNNYYFTSGTTDYYLTYSCEWSTSSLPYFTISDNGSNYLTFQSESSYSNVTDESLSTHFYFSNADGANSSGTIYFLYNGSKYYLSTNGEQIATTTNQAQATSWTNDGTHLYNQSNYIGYHGGEWKIVNTTTYTISYTTGGSTYYLINSGGSLGRGQDASSATRWTFSNTSNQTYPSGTITSTYNGQTYYLRVESKNSGCNNNTISLQVSTTNSNNSWTNNNGVLSISVNNKTAYIYYSSNEFGVNTNNKTTLTFTKATGPNALVSEHNEKTSVLFEEVQIGSEAISTGPVDANLEVLFTDTTKQIVEKTVKENVSGGYQTYIPLKIAKSDEDGWYDSQDPYKASLNNTGYIISGARIQETSATSQQKGAGDIRISYFPISSISTSYTQNASSFNSIYTVDGSGIHEMTSSQYASETYQNASSQLIDTLKGQSSVYGLHFMDAKISTDYLLTADKAVVLNKVYTNYEMPIDSIDFKIIERGTISFFAGAYFTNNDTFFSLHQVFRDSNDKITAIKEITEIYQYYQSGSNKNYIYKFSDGTYSDRNGKYSGSLTLDPEYNSTPIFKTVWITSPGISEENKIYYFEIPCNSGEYCLGSVEGKTGAYLIYLDIAANGGDVIDTVVSSTGNAIANEFQVDVREAGDEKSPYSLLQYSVSIPDTALNDNFSITISFDDTARDPSDPSIYSKGLYTIEIDNRTGSDIKLSIFLIDDDDDVTNNFD